MKEQRVADHEVVMWTPHFVVVKNERGQEITLRTDGRMVVRKAASETLARQSAAEIMEIVMKDFIL